jgi:hypothetical protein
MVARGRLLWGRRGRLGIDSQGYGERQGYLNSANPGELAFRLGRDGGGEGRGLWEGDRALEGCFAKVLAVSGGRAGFGCIFVHAVAVSAGACPV